MPKITRQRGKAATSSTSATTERPRRSTRVNPTNSEADINNTKPKSTRTSRGKPKKQSQPLYTRSASQANSDPNRRLPLFKLPTELLKHIASTYLSLESALSLSLTCKEALSTLGTWSWAAFKKEKRWSEARTNFFEGLARDWQQEEGVKVDLEFCNRCNTLHPGLKRPSRHCKTALTTYCFGQDACIDYLPRKVESDDRDCDAEDSEERGWSLVSRHIKEALQSSSSHSQKGQYGPPIPLLSGDFSTASRDSNVHLRLLSSARRVDGNLLVRHEYIFQKAGLCAKDILDLRLYLCPHQCTTQTGPPETSRYIKSEGKNGPLFAHAINSAFPKQRQARISPSLFRSPTASERRNMDEADQAGGQTAPIWSCRSCSTKYSVELMKHGDLRILSWHCFGRNLEHARKYWRYFVRREGKLLSRDKRNDEWWSPTGMGVQDFVIGE